LADGEMLTPVSVLDGCFRFEAPEGVQSLRLRSRSAVPAQQVEIDRSDTRRLGVLLTRLEVGGREIALNDFALADGWHEVEGAAPNQWRWSNGDASLPTGSSLTIWLRPLSAAYPLPPRRRPIPHAAQAGSPRRALYDRAAS